MSQMRTYEMIFFLGEDQALSWYLTHGCFPSVPTRMYDPAKAAIAACAEDDPERTIVNVDGESVCSAIQLVVALDLDPFVEAAKLANEEEAWDGVEP